MVSGFMKDVRVSIIMNTLDHSQSRPQDRHECQVGGVDVLRFILGPERCPVLVSLVRAWELVGVGIYEGGWILRSPYWLA